MSETIDQLFEALKQTQDDKRTAVIVSSLESKMTFDHLKMALNNEVETIYLRQYEMDYRSSETRGAIVQEVRYQLASCLQNNMKLVLVIDENKPEGYGVAWREMYDPDVSHLINATSEPLPTQILKHSDLQGHLEGILNEQEQPVSFQDGYQFLMWSKTKHISEAQILAKAAASNKSEEETSALIDSELLKAFKNRFEHCLPMHAVNMIFIESAALQNMLASSQQQDGSLSAQQE